MQRQARYVDISKIAGVLGQEISEALLGLHGFTGVSAATATMLGPQLMSFSPLKSSLQRDFGMIAIVSSVLLDQADLPRQHLHNLGVVGQGH